MLSDRQAMAKRAAVQYFGGGPVISAFGAGAEGSVSEAIAPTLQNIIGIGIGVKVSDGMALTGQDAVRIYVRSKIPRRQVSRQMLIPERFGELPTDVVEVGNVEPLQTIQSWQRHSRHRPTSCGVSVSHPDVTAGTLGCLVQKDGRRFILSNNHVLANCDLARPGDPILQPGTLDGGRPPGDTIARLSKAKEIDFSGAPNEIDAAIAELTDADDVEPEIIDIGQPGHQPRVVELFESVRKHGRTTGHTVGVVSDVSASLWVPYQGRRAWFDNQFAIQGVGPLPFAAAGDSGSLIVDAVTLAPVGLLFAGSNVVTFANRIEPVLNYFGVGIV